MTGCDRLGLGERLTFAETVVYRLSVGRDHEIGVPVEPEERGGLARPSYEEAERFLDKLDDARTLLRVQLAPAPSGSGGEGKGGSDAPDHRP